MAIAPGTVLGSYEIRALLGAGGMGEVYRAHDSELGRDVAIKVLPAEVAGDPSRLTRLRREARLLASLSHPNIAAIHGVAHAPGVQGLVLELVEGPTLGDLLQREPLPVSETLGIARQICQALEAAHEQGVIHRDLKPANVKVRADGTVKVLDFGLAKALAVDGEANSSQAPTMTAAETQAGSILGTAAYMSPEQARGRALDRRTDIWAFGCVLYQMLTARRAFEGDTFSDVLSAVLSREPDWSRLPQDTPVAVRRLVRRCLTKDPKQRLRDFGDAIIELDEAAEPAADAVSLARTKERSGAPGALVAAALVVALGAGWLLASWFGRTDEPPPRVTRLTVALPPNQQLDTASTAAPLALSEDGLQLAYVARGEDARTRLYLRRLDAFEAVPVPDTEGARYPFFSPDGNWVAYFANGKLKRASVRGGAPLTVCDVPEVGRGGVWMPDDTIIFVAGNAGLKRVSARGGVPNPLLIEGLDTNVTSISWPALLPDGRNLLVSLGSDLGEALAALSLETGHLRELGPGSQARYLPTGHLLFHASHVREGELRVVGLDPDRIEPHGEPVAVLDGVFRAANAGAVYFAVSRNGTLVFAPGGLAHALVLVERGGQRTPLIEDRRGFRFPRLSPDGHRIAVTIDPRPSQVWVYDLVRRTGIPLATEGHSLAPMWSPDGKRVIYTTHGDLYSRAADGSTPAERLLSRPGAQYASSWTPDGKTLLFTEQLATRKFSIWRLAPARDPSPVIATVDNESVVALSPDGRWLAYGSDQTGRSEVYVRPYPAVETGKWLISADGGHSPLWSPDGRELFYMNGAKVLAVPVIADGASLTIGEPVELFEGPFDVTQDRNFDLAPEGTGFVMIEVEPFSRPTRLQVVTDWFEEVRLLPLGHRDVTER
jgi:eukaryotic-like serine/threonine-protein kinase